MHGLKEGDVKILDALFLAQLFLFSSAMSSAASFRLDASFFFFQSIAFFQCRFVATTCQLAIFHQLGGQFHSFQFDLVSIDGIIDKLLGD